MRGPLPKLNAERRRTNADGQNVELPATGAPMPAADPDWHPLAARWYASLGESVQSQLYEASDWQLAFITARELTAYWEGPASGARFDVIMRLTARLLTTHVDRLRSRIETHPGDNAVAPVPTPALPPNVRELREKLQG